MITVVICTHNPRPDYFGRTIEALRRQTLPTTQWELLVVDNASEPGRGPQEDLAWHPRARTVQEPKLGLTPARLCGIREAAGDLLVLVDDDNVLDPDYLEQAQAVAEARPYLGAWSGQCRPDFEVQPPEWTRRYWGNLAIREFDEDVWSNLPRLADTMPCGAGLCVRREVARRYLEVNESGQRAFQFDRAGGSLVSGGDNDLAACACDLGLGVGLVAALKLQHLMPPERLTADYLARLAEGIQFSGTLLDAQWGLAPQPRSLLGRLADMLRMLRQRGPDRRIAQAVNRGHRRAMALLAASSEREPPRAH